MWLSLSCLKQNAYSTEVQDSSPSNSKDKPCIPFSGVIPATKVRVRLQQNLLETGGWVLLSHHLRHLRTWRKPHAGGGSARVGCSDPCSFSHPSALINLFLCVCVSSRYCAPRVPALLCTEKSTVKAPNQPNACSTPLAPHSRVSAQPRLLPTPSTLSDERSL